jgi:hypothetical protein
VLCGATLPIRLWEVPEDATAVEDDGASQDKFPLGQFTHARIVGVTKSTTLPETAYIAAEYELPDEPGEWVPLDGDAGPILEIGPTAVGSDTEKAREGVWVEILDLARTDVRIRGVIVGGDEDAAKAVVLARHVLQLMAQNTENVEPPEMEDPAPEDPGSCTVPSPIDMDTGWSETGGGAGNTWSNLSDTTADLEVDGSETGANYWAKTLTGLEPDALYTVYLDTETDELGVGPFLTVDGGDTDTADETTDTLVARGDSDCDGNLTLHWGVQESEGGAVSSGSDGLEYASQGAAEAAGWTVTDTIGNGNGEWSFGATDQVVQGSMSLKGRLINFGGSGAGALRMSKTFDSGDGITANTAYTVTVQGRLNARSGFDAHKRLRAIGATTQTVALGDAAINAWQTLDVTVNSTAGAELTVELEAAHAFIKQDRTVWFDDLQIQGLGGTSAVQFDDLRMCLGTGIGDEGTGVGGDPDTPGVEEPPEEPPGGWPDPPTPLTKIFGIHDIPSEGLSYWSNTVKVARADNVVNLINSARTAECNLFLRMGNDADWDAGSRFSYDRWKDAIDSVYEDTRSRAALEAAILDGTASAHYIIDEPYHPYRYGGPIPFATVERMFTYSKQLFPTWRTILRVDPTMDWLARAMSGCDTYWAEYLKARGPIDSYIRGRTEAAQDLDGDLIWGIHYAAFDRSGTPRDITPDEMRHYGGLLARACGAYGIGLCGWKYTSSMFRQAGMPEAVRYVRDLLASV